MKKIFLMFTVLLLATRLSAESNAPVRLALVAESDEASTASDVLTVQLSGNEKIHLLERNEIEKVYREQGLSAANRDYLKLGRLLGADGLLLLDVIRTPQATNLMARLIAVKPGVVLTDGSFPWPLKDTMQWAESVAAGLDSFLPKLTLLAKDAIPLSVVNLRSAVQSAEAQETERQLKLLTIQRLSQERQFFVLERQRMQLLSEEKELKSDESAFWDGSYLLEGVVDQSGYSKDTITINARLTPPKGAAPLLFEVAGSRTNLAEVINRLAAKVTELLKVNSTVKEWNAADEAQQYFEEAKWALRWGVYSEAQAAADSAWALGKQDMEGASVRVKSYLAEAEPAGLNELYEMGTYRDETGTPGYVSSFIQDTTKANHGRVLFSQTTNTVQYVILKNQPDQLKFLRLVHTLELYNAQLNSLQWSDPTARKEWCELGTSLLKTAGQWLRDYYLNKQARVEVETQLESARRLCREIATALLVMPEADNERFWDAVGGFGVFWCETPEEGVALYRKLIELRQFASLREHATGCYPCNRLLLPMLADWKGDNRNRAAQCWYDLVDTLCASPDRELQANGYFCICADTEDAEKFKPAFEKMRSSLYHEQAMAYDIDNMFVEKGGSQKWEELENRLWAPFRESEHSIADAVHWSPKQPKINWVTNQPVPQSFPNLQPNIARFLSGPQFRPATNRPSPMAKSAEVAPHTIKAQPTNLIEVTRFWEIPLTNELTFTNYSDKGEIQGFSTWGAASSVIAFCNREGHLWVEVDRVCRSVHERFFFQVNLDTFTSECIPIDNERYHPQDSDAFAGPFRTFEVYSNYLYASSSDGIKRYSLARKTWEDLPVPVGGHARITAFDGRIFLTSASAIIEMSPDGQTSKVLASTRRRPPLTTLDTMEGYYVKVAPDWSSCKLFAPVFPGPDGSVIAFLKGQFYALAKGASDWTPWKEVPGSSEPELSYTPKGLLILTTLDVSSPPMAAELYLARAGSTNVDCIVADGPTASDQVFLSRTGVHRQEPPAHWNSPEGMRVANWPACLDGDSIWVLYGPPNDLTLLHFVPGRAKPMSYHLHLKQPMAGNARFTWNQPYKWIQIEATPQGIVFGGAGASPGFWFVPATDLQRIDQSELSNNQK